MKKGLCHKASVSEPYYGRLYNFRSEFENGQCAKINFPTIFPAIWLWYKRVMNQSIINNQQIHN